MHVPTSNLANVALGSLNLMSLGEYTKFHSDFENQNNNKNLRKFAKFEVGSCTSCLYFGVKSLLKMLFAISKLYFS